jgi:Lrp/AsnC family transcriptional regulator for asnA, asnC and gidA
MFAEIICKDITQLRRILHDELQKIKGIERTETLISLEESFYRTINVVE